MICKGRKFRVEGRDVVDSRFRGNQDEILFKSGEVFSEVLELFVHPVDLEVVCIHFITHRLVLCINHISS